MLLTGHQPNYLPWLGFLHKIAVADAFVLVDNVQYVKRGTFGWMHRNKIRTHEGWQWLSVPILSKGKYTQRIDEALINPREPWRARHRRAIETNYSKAPHFEEYWPPFAALYEQEWERFVDFSEAVIRALLQGFGIDRKVIRSSALGAEGPALELIASMCEKMGAARYLSGVHGRDYLDLAFFAARGLAVEFQDFTHPVYPQCRPGPFEPGMAGIDLLFNCGGRALEMLMSGGRPTAGQAGPTEAAS